MLPQLPLDLFDLGTPNSRESMRLPSPDEHATSHACKGFPGVSGLRSNRTDGPFPGIIGQHPIVSGRHSAHAWTARNGGRLPVGRVGQNHSAITSSGKHHFIPAILIFEKRYYSCRSSKSISSTKNLPPSPGRRPNLESPRRPQLDKDRYPRMCLEKEKPTETRNRTMFGE